MDTVSPQASTTYVALQLGATTLLLPQRHVRTLEPDAGLDLAEPPPNGVGWIGFMKQPVPVYSLSAELRPQSGRVPGYWICSLLDSGEQVYGLLCSEVQFLKDAKLDVHPLPAAMRQPGSPLTGLAVHEGKPACLSSAAQLWSYIQARAWDGRTMRMDAA